MLHDAGSTSPFETSCRNCSNVLPGEGGNMDTVFCSASSLESSAEAKPWSGTTLGNAGVPCPCPRFTTETGTRCLPTPECTRAETCRMVGVITAQDGTDGVCRGVAVRLLGCTTTGSTRAVASGDCGEIKGCSNDGTPPADGDGSTGAAVTGPGAIAVAAVGGAVATTLEPTARYWTFGEALHSTCGVCCSHRCSPLGDCWAVVVTSCCVAVGGGAEAPAPCSTT
mmetsp:Transcript_18024/g.50066  ORF Transcript_18024/g.50066 Transcript_18024/m.50066 type:complete len:225 (-) Transcript_18024:495-1169(-)